MEKDKIVALRRDVSIAWIWLHLGLSGKVGRLCKSPFHEDKHPSFSVWGTPEGDKWKDHSTGEFGDCIDFYAKAREIGIGVAIVELLRLRNISIPPVSEKRKESKQPAPVWRKPSTDECQTLGQLRGLDPGAFALAGQLGTLRIGQHPDTKESLWWLTDLNGYSWEGRTFDGSVTKATGKKVAALAGSRKDYPVGLKTANTSYDQLTRLMLVEGSSDYFAGIHMAMRTGINFRIASVLGASCNICDDALACFKDTSVVILAHNDEHGRTAAERWKGQLSKAPGTYITVQPLPQEIKDLNDWMLTPLFAALKS